MSQNMIVSDRRSTVETSSRRVPLRGPGGGSDGARAGDTNAAPQSPQNLLPAGLSTPQTLQIMSGSPQPTCKPDAPVRVRSRHDGDLTFPGRSSFAEWSNGEGESTGYAVRHDIV
ncbi:MAG: hypothetical protein AB7O80_15685, partial [Acetobacteraceae bacterium]